MILSKGRGDNNLKKNAILIIGLVLVLVFSINLLIKYNSTSITAGYVVELVEKYQSQNKYWAKFFDIFSEDNVDIIVGKEVYEELEYGVKYVITYKSNKLFKDPVLQKIEISDLN